MYKTSQCLALYVDVEAKREITQTIQDHILSNKFRGSERPMSSSSCRSASSIPLQISTVSIDRTQGVRAQSLCPKYRAKNRGRVIYAARNDATEKLPGKNIWKPLVRHNRISIIMAK